MLGRLPQALHANETMPFEAVTSSLLYNYLFENILCFSRSREMAACL